MWTPIVFQMWAGIACYIFDGCPQLGKRSRRQLDSSSSEEPALDAGVGLRQIDEPAVENNLVGCAISDVRGRLIRRYVPDDEIGAGAGRDRASAREPEGTSCR